MYVSLPSILLYVGFSGFLLAYSKPEEAERHLLLLIEIFI